MTITERQMGAVTVLSVSGKITLEDSGQLKGKVTSVVEAGHKQIVLDLGGVTYIDSSGLGEMVSCYTTVARNQGAIKLASVGARSKDLLVMTKLITVFEVHDTVNQAIASFVQPA